MTAAPFTEVVAVKARSFSGPGVLASLRHHDLQHLHDFYLIIIRAGCGAHPPPDTKPGSRSIGRAAQPSAAHGLAAHAARAHVAPKTSSKVWA